MSNRIDGRAVAVIVAAGSSRRMDGVDKVFTTLAGRPLIDERGQALRARQRQEPRLAQQQAERRRDRPARRLEHVSNA